MNVVVLPLAQIAFLSGPDTDADGLQICITYQRAGVRTFGRESLGCCLDCHRCPELSIVSISLSFQQ